MGTPKKAAAVSVGVIAAGLLTAAPAQASSDDVVKEGRCSLGSTFELKVGLDDGRLDIEFEVDSNRVGQRWFVRITDNGDRIFADNRITRAPSGSFTVDLRARNRPGTDRIRAVATTQSTGERCEAVIVF
jgi:hypothetical protein